MKKFLISGLILLTAVAVGCGGKKQAAATTTEKKEDTKKDQPPPAAGVETAKLEVIALIDPSAKTMTIVDASFGVPDPADKEKKKLIELKKVADGADFGINLTIAGKTTVANPKAGELAKADKDEILKLKKGTNNPSELKDFFSTLLVKMEGKIKKEYLVANQEIPLPNPAYALSDDQFDGKAEPKIEQVTGGELKITKSTKEIAGRVYRSKETSDSSARFWKVEDETCGLLLAQADSKVELALPIDFASGTIGTVKIDKDNADVVKKIAELKVTDLQKPLDAWVECGIFGASKETSKKTKFQLTLRVRTPVKVAIVEGTS